VVNERLEPAGAMLRDELDALLAEGPEGAARRERDTFERLAAPFGTRIVLFGAGGLGRRVLASLRTYGIEPLAFCDNDARLWTASVNGVAVLSPAEAVQRFGASASFVVTVWGALGHDRMRDRVGQLQDLGCKNAFPFLPLAWKYPSGALPHYGAGLPSGVHAAANRVRGAFDLLSDDASRLEYVRQIRWRLFGDFDALTEPVHHPIYFPRDLCALRPDEVFVDCGAYDGDTVRLFVREAHSTFGGIYAFEPDPVSFEKLAATLRKLPGAGGDTVAAFPYATGAKSERMRFIASGTAMSALGDGDLEVEVRTLDETLAAAKPTYIKMDIEGSEPDALAGARRIVSEESPVLAISCYHRQEHLWEIPLQIHALNPGYRFYLRPHDLEMWDLICYAVPFGRSA
jgi:FkbM family methyltransferase